METTGTHRRLALYMVRACQRVSQHVAVFGQAKSRSVEVVGQSDVSLVVGFMLASALLSMWISNTATTVVMLPIALSVIRLLINDEDGFTKNDQNFALSIMLGIAFSANVGGIATIIGTPPNTVMAGFLENEYQIEISFLKWMMLGVPFAILMITIIYFVIVKWIYPNHLPQLKDSKDLITKELDNLGSMSKTEKRVLIIFFAAIFLWVFRTLINPLIPALQLSDAGISMLAAFSLFAIPFEFNKGAFALEWKDTEKLPWGILILFGGGLALASAMSQAGIIDMIGKIIAESNGLSIIAVTSILIVVMLFMTELMSNVALVAIFAPAVAGIAIGLDAEMLHLLIPVTMASSCAFMLPMATPPNAIVFASGYIKVHEMARVGFFLNMIAVFLLILLAKWVIPVIF